MGQYTLKKITKFGLSDFFDYIKTINYGCKDKDGKIHINQENFSNIAYSFSSPEEVVKNNCGWCWDIANLIKYYCKEDNIEHKTYFMEYLDTDFHQTHTQVILKMNNEWFLAPDNLLDITFGQNGFLSPNECIMNIVASFTDFLRHALKEKYEAGNLLLKEFTCAIPSGISDEEYLSLVRK